MAKVRVRPETKKLYFDFTFMQKRVKSTLTFLPSYLGI